MNNRLAFNLFIGTLAALNVEYEISTKNPLEVNIPVPMNCIENPKGNEIFNLTEKEIVEGADNIYCVSDEVCIKVNFADYNRYDSPSWLVMTDKYTEEENN